VFEQFPTLAQNVGPKLGTMSCLQLMNVMRGDWAKRQGWGWHDMASWQNFFDVSASIGQNQTPISAADVCTNDLIPGANAFDAAKVKADAEAAGVPAGFEDVSVDEIRATMFDQAVGAKG
jgi:NitT/TauT family transport system substrate-binding protein